MFYIIPAIVSVIDHIKLYNKHPEYFKNGEVSIAIIIVLCGIPLFNIYIYIYLMYRSIMIIIETNKYRNCEHEYITITNLYGDMINNFGGARSIRKCIHCDKIEYGELDENCKKK